MDESNDQAAPAPRPPPAGANLDTTTKPQKTTGKHRATVTVKKPARTVGAAKRKRVESAEIRAQKLARIMSAEEEDAFFRRMTSYMDSKFKGVNQNLENNTSKLSEVTTSVAGLTTSVAANKADIATLKSQISDLQRKDNVEEKVEELVRRTLDRRAAPTEKLTADFRRVENEVQKIKTLQHVSKKDSTSQEERHYWWSRRAVRIWPVVGTTNKELWTTTGEFFFKTLEVPESYLSEDSVESVRQIFPAKTRTKGRITDEVRMLFKDVKTRDMVYSYAINLANKRDRAGMRLEVPGHLLGQFKTLERYGRQLKQEHGQNIKWHIKYDDPELSMFLNVKLGDEGWNKITFDTAREETRRLDTGASITFRERLTSSQSGTSTGDDEEVMEVSPSLPISSTLEKYKKNPPASSTPRWGQRK